MLEGTMDAKAALMENAHVISKYYYTGSIDIHEKTLSLGRGCKEEV